jgi:hypothetical protein
MKRNLFRLGANVDVTDCGLTSTRRLSKVRRSFQLKSSEIYFRETLSVFGDACWQRYLKLTVKTRPGLNIEHICGTRERLLFYESKLFICRRIIVLENSSVVTGCAFRLRVFGCAAFTFAVFFYTDRLANLRGPYSRRREIYRWIRAEI